MKGEQSKKKKILVLGIVIAIVIFLIGYLELTGPVRSKNCLAIIELSGEISYEKSSPFISGNVITPDEVRKILETVKEDESVKGILLVINSPGGSAAASEEIYYQIKSLSEKKTVATYITEYGASGGYMIALPSKEIIASPLSLTGSVGAVSILINYENLLEKIGVKVYTFKSGSFKDVGSPYRTLTESEQELFTEMVNETANNFIKKVVENRGNKVNISEIETARPYLGEQALKVGLIDKIGSFEYAVFRAKQLSGLPEDTPTKVISPPKPSILDALLNQKIFNRSFTEIPTELSYEILLMWPLPAQINFNE
jgi:protease-4